MRLLVKRGTAAIVVSLSALSLAAKVPGRAAPSPAAARLETLFGGLHARGLFDGAVVIGQRDAILWEKGFGEANVAAGVPFTPDTPADGASLAKTFTAALLFSLDSQGRLSHDEPAQRLLPELPYPDVTLRHLITHTSGLPGITTPSSPSWGRTKCAPTRSCSE